MCLKSNVYLKAIVEKLPLFFDFPNFQKNQTVQNPTDKRIHVLIQTINIH